MDQLYSLPTNYETREYYFAILDSLGERTKMMALPKFQRANQFTIRAGSGEGGSLKIEQSFLQHLKFKILISCTVGNGIYIFDPIKNILTHRELLLELVPLEKEGQLKIRVHSRGEFEEELSKLATQISYLSFVWDEKSQRYYRFASRVISPKTEFKVAKLEVFLMAFSKDMELLCETEVEGLHRVPRGFFFKDGKLWSHVNVEDELGFGVMDFNLFNFSDITWN